MASYASCDAAMQAKRLQCDNNSTLNAEQKAACTRQLNILTTPGSHANELTCHVSGYTEPYFVNSKTPLTAGMSSQVVLGHHRRGVPTIVIN